MPADRATPSLDEYGRDELILAGRHLEDLWVFAGQRSRLHPEPGWAPVLRMLEHDLAAVRAELGRRGG